MQDKRKPLGGVTKESFVHSSKDAELNAEYTYDILSGLSSVLLCEIQDIKNQCTCRMGKCSERMSAQDKTIARLGKVNMAVSAGGGIVGGFLAMIAKIKFWG
jgi:hypothetical protein